MANAEQVALLKKSANEWNERRRKDPKFIRFIPELRGADLHGADLAEANLVGADLGGANLRGADLGGADLAGAYLLEANLLGADLVGADLGGAQLGGADLAGAYLLEANLLGADLDGTKLSEAIVGRTNFADVDLGVVEGLGRVHHSAPSTIGVDTILKSGGKIPDEFLRGCGVDPLIQKMLVGDAQSKTDAFSEWISRRHNPLQRCFISYATEDKPFVDHLQKALNECGVDYWYAPEHGRWGEELHRQIDLEISLRDRMLLVLQRSLVKKRLGRIRD